MIDKIVTGLTQRRRVRAAAQSGRRRALARPVISVGNVSMGGSGKSPLVAHVARILLDMGEKPSVLSRGYARPRPMDGALVVSDGAQILAPYDQAGDEPLMLARQLPGCAVVVCPDRYLAGSLAERRLGCTVHVLDDGFQHVQLARALDIVIVRRTDLDDRVMPLGRLREPLAAIAAADAVVVDAADDLDDAALVGMGARRIFTMTRRVGAPREEQAFAFAGIGRPAEFFEVLRQNRWTLVGSRPFPDHHPYSTAELTRLADEGKAAGAELLVTTEKDAARIQDQPQVLPLHAVPLTLSVEPAGLFASVLAESIREAAR